MGSRPVTVKHVMKIRKSKQRYEKSFEKSSTVAENPNCELLLAYYASETSMSKKIKSLYEAIFAHEEQDIYEINLSYMDFDVKSAYHLKIILHFFINLQELRLSAIGLNSKNLKRLSRSLSVFTKLTCLHLDSNQLDFDGIHLICRYFRFWDRLRVLNLSYNDLGHECFEVISKSISLLGDLNELNLNGNRANDQCLHVLAEAVTDLRYLQTMKLSSNYIMFDGAKKIIASCKGLQFIDLTKNEINKNAAFLLISRFPEVEILI